jgi:hypothetical protein
MSEIKAAERFSVDLAEASISKPLLSASRYLISQGTVKNKQFPGLLVKPTGELQVNKK